MRRLFLLALVVVACAACGSAKHVAAPTGPAAPKNGFEGYVFHPPVAAPQFALKDQAGTTVGPKTLHGKWIVVAFIYTHCPDVCPLIASNLAAAQRQLPTLGVLGVSVDPKGDTPASVKRFIAAHGLTPRFHYVTGTRAQLAPVWRDYHVAAVGGAKGTVSHSSFELLIDPQGRERVLFDQTMRAADVERAIAKLS